MPKLARNGALRRCSVQIESGERAGAAVAGLPLLLLLPHLVAVMAGLMLVGVGTFFAQATATGFVGRAATTDRGSASGIYLACYFFGGIVGSIVLGQLFDRFGWAACVAGIGAALVLAALLALRLKMSAPVLIAAQTV
jgi:YNFM family putative membrane transporter